MVVQEEKPKKKEKSKKEKKVEVEVKTKKKGMISQLSSQLVFHRIFQKILLICLVFVIFLLK